jgi:hypothetical protein
LDQPGLSEHGKIPSEENTNIGKGVAIMAAPWENLIDQDAREIPETTEQDAETA